VEKRIDINILYINKVILKIKNIILFTIISMFITTNIVSAQYKTLETVPNIAADSDFPAYVTGFYNFAIAFVLIAALLMITIGGFYYITSAGNQAQASTAKRIITDALLGLIIVFVTYLILHTINPDLVGVDGTGDLQNLRNVVNKNDSNESEFDDNTPWAGWDFNNAINDDIVTPNNEPPNNDGIGCGGLATSNIKKEQCNDASKKLSEMLKCVHDKSPNLKINSISDDATIRTPNNCRGNNYHHPPCAHHRNSCHYGGSDGNDKSCAVDISTRLWNKPFGMSNFELMQLLKDCGAAFVHDESKSTNHIHASVTGCNCDGHN